MTAPPPALEMLWEADDPAETLRRRFGHDDAAAAGRWVTATLARHWDLDRASCRRIVMSHTNALAWVDAPSGPLVAKWSIAPEGFARLAALARLTVELEARGVPVSAPVAARDGRLQVEVDGVSLGLQHVVAGDLLDTDDHDLVRATGAVVARLHDALATSPAATDLLALVDPPEPLATRVTAWVDTAPHHLPSGACDTLRRLVVGLAADTSGVLPTQLVHGDVRAANVLCAGGDVVAVLDLEEARGDHAVVELARSAVLLGTRFHAWGPVSPAVHASLRAGYETVRRLTPLEARWWDVLVLWAALAMVPAGEDPTGWGAAAGRLAARLERSSDHHTDHHTDHRTATRRPR